jgi:hypothetical protein
VQPLWSFRQFFQSREGELKLFGSVGEHGPDLAFAADASLEDKGPPIGSPEGIVVAFGFRG